MKPKNLIILFIYLGMMSMRTYSYDEKPSYQITNPNNTLNSILNLKNQTPNSNHSLKDDNTGKVNFFDLAKESQDKTSSYDHLSKFDHMTPSLNFHNDLQRVQEFGRGSARQEIEFQRKRAITELNNNKNYSKQNFINKHQEIYKYDQILKNME